jgi:hypothetical protein
MARVTEYATDALRWGVVHMMISLSPIASVI